MRVRLGPVIVGAAALLLVTGAVGVLGAWALGTGVIVIVASSVVTAIVWGGARSVPSTRASAAAERRNELVPAQTPSGARAYVPRGR